MAAHKLRDPVGESSIPQVMGPDRVMVDDADRIMVQAFLLQEMAVARSPVVDDLLDGRDDAIERLYRTLYAELANLYRASDRVQIDEDFLLGAAASVLKTDTEFSAAIALSFRINLVNVFFAGDLYAGTGVVVDPKHPPKVGDSLEETQRVLRNKPFAEYFTRVFAPYYLKHRANSTASSLIADNRLDIIGDSLRNDADYYAQTNSDDVLLNRQELTWLQDTLGPRIAVYDHGGHLGNIGERQQVSDMLKMLGGNWPEPAK